MTVERRRLVAFVGIFAGALGLTLLSPWAQRVLGGGIPWTEAVGVSTGAVCVWLAAVSDPWTWPIGIANNLFYVVIFWRVGLYGEVALQLVFASIAVYGIWRWRGRRAGEVRPVVRGSRGELALVGAVIVVLGVVFWRILAGATDSTVPGWDGSTTAVSLAAQWLMSRRVIENWWLWIAVDVVYVPLYAYKGLLSTAALYAVYMALCVLGLRDWRRELEAQRAAAAASARDGW